MRIAELVVDVRIRQLERALKYLAGEGCENYVDYPKHQNRPAEHGACAENGRSAFAKYSGDRWCAACFAKAALEGKLPTEQTNVDGRAAEIRMIGR